MADDTNKVTIDAAWFAELYEDHELAKLHRKRGGECEACAVMQERDELKAELDCAERENNKYRAMPTEYRHCKERLAAAERCIEDCENALINIMNLHEKVDADEMLNIILAYRAAKEAK